MPVWLGPLLWKVLDFAWHAIKRFWSVFLVAAVLWGCVLQYKSFKNKIYNLGYKAGYSRAVTDHPTYGHVNSVTNNAVTSGDESATLTHSITASSVVQPYIVVYMWKRTA